MFNRHIWSLFWVYDNHQKIISYNVVRKNDIICHPRPCHQKHHHTDSKMCVHVGQAVNNFVAKVSLFDVTLVCSVSARISILRFHWEFDSRLSAICATFDFLISQLFLSLKNSVFNVLQGFTSSKHYDLVESWNLTCKQWLGVLYNTHVTKGFRLRLEHDLLHFNTLCKEPIVVLREDDQSSHNQLLLW
jgi:hypothetical protein